MQRTHRHPLDPKDPYWPRVRRLHILLWGRGAQDAPTGSILAHLFGGIILFPIIDGMFVFAKLIVLSIALYIFDIILPGKVLCMVDGTFLFNISATIFSSCDMHTTSITPIVQVCIILLFIYILIYPAKKFFGDVSIFIFYVISVFLLGKPVRWIARYVAHDPDLLSRFLDKNAIFQMLSSSIRFESPFHRELDGLWDVYAKSKNPNHEGHLDKFLKDFESRYS